MAGTPGLKVELLAPNPTEITSQQTSASRLTPVLMNLVGNFTALHPHYCTL